MATMNYISVSGQIITEETGGVQTDYVTDALGSVVATVDQNAQVINRYTYKPYGGLLSKTGTGPDPKFRWVGSWGYRQTSKRFSDVYVRARHYASALGRWTTKDVEFIYHANNYCYSESNPTTVIDLSGAAPTGKGKKTLNDCKKMSPGHCFWCAYELLLSDNRKLCPQKACEEAKKLCKSKVICGPCGPYGYLPYQGNCSSSAVYNYADWIRSKCGGSLKGADKLAHCWGACMAELCVRFLGACYVRWRWRFENDPNDILAEKRGLECADRKNREFWLFTTFEYAGDYCMKCCAKKIYDMKCD